MAFGYCTHEAFSWIKKKEILYHVRGKQLSFQRLMNYSISKCKMRISKIKSSTRLSSYETKRRQIRSRIRVAQMPYLIQEWHVHDKHRTRIWRVLLAVKTKYVTISIYFILFHIIYYFISFYFIRNILDIIYFGSHLNIFK